MNPDRCTEDYLETLSLPTARTEDVLFAYRYEMVWRSLRWWATRPELTKRRLRPTDVNRICDAAEYLLAQVPEPPPDPLSPDLHAALTSRRLTGC